MSKLDICVYRVLACVGRVTDVPSIIVSHELLNDIATMMKRWHIFLGCEHELLGRKTTRGSTAKIRVCDLNIQETYHHWPVHTLKLI